MSSRARERVRLREKNIGGSSRLLHIVKYRCALLQPPSEISGWFWRNSQAAAATTSSTQAVKSVIMSGVVWSSWESSDRSDKQHTQQKYWSENYGISSRENFQPIEDFTEMSFRDFFFVLFPPLFHVLHHHHRQVGRRLPPRAVNCVLRELPSIHIFIVFSRAESSCLMMLQQQQQNSIRKKNWIWHITECTSEREECGQMDLNPASSSHLG